MFKTLSAPYKDDRRTSEAADTVDINGALSVFCVISADAWQGWEEDICPLHGLTGSARICLQDAAIWRWRHAYSAAGTLLKA